MKMPTNCRSRASRAPRTRSSGSGTSSATRAAATSMTQLTWRAVIMGSVLGGVLSLTNLYIGLKAGWGFGVAITACILSYAIWTGFYKIGLAKTQMTILENNCMQSTASVGGLLDRRNADLGLRRLHPAQQRRRFPFRCMLGWVFFLAVLGVTMAVPMKRQMINIEQLRFPSGIAAAETLRALHSTGRKGMRAARALGIGGLFAALSQFWPDGLRLDQREAGSVPALHLRRPLEREDARAGVDRSDGDLRSGIRSSSPPACSSGCGSAISMLIGSITCWMMFVPWLQAHVPEAAGVTGFRDLVQWTPLGRHGLHGDLRHPGRRCCSGRARCGRSGARRHAVRASRSRRRAVITMEAIEVPNSWFFSGQLVSLVGLALAGPRHLRHALLAERCSRSC